MLSYHFHQNPHARWQKFKIFLLVFVTVSSKISSVISNDQLSSGVFISFARLDGLGLLRIMLDSFHFLETFGLSVVHVRTLYFPTLALQIFLSCGTTGSQFRLFKVSDSISNVSFLGTSFLTNRMSSVLFSSASDLLQKLSPSLCLNKIHLSASKKKFLCTLIYVRFKEGEQNFVTIHLFSSLVLVAICHIFMTKRKNECSGFEVLWSLLCHFYFDTFFEWKKHRWILQHELQLRVISLALLPFVQNNYMFDQNITSITETIWFLLVNTTWKWQKVKNYWKKTK